MKGLLLFVLLSMAGQVNAQDAQLCEDAASNFVVMLKASRFARGGGAGSAAYSRKADRARLQLTSALTELCKRPKARACLAKRIDAFVAEINGALRRYGDAVAAYNKAALDYRANQDRRAGKMAEYAFDDAKQAFFEEYGAPEWWTLDDCKRSTVADQLRECGPRPSGKEFVANNCEESGAR